MEIYKDVIGYEGLYQVSNFGNIKSLERDYFTDKGIHVRKRERILKQGLGEKGYKLVVLYKEKKGKTQRVHRLVAMAFLNNTDKVKNEVNHIDGDKENNRLSNLEWSSRSANVKHAYDVGLIDILKKSGVNNPSAKLTEKQVIEIRELHNAGQTNSFISKTLKINEQLVCNVNSYKTYKNVKVVS